MVFMDGDDIKVKVPIWANAIGKLKAKRLLLLAGVGYTTAVFLINGNYNSVPKARLIAKINMAMNTYFDSVPKK
jgi:hypothetical protein